jgi:PKD domain-containing protein
MAPLRAPRKRTAGPVWWKTGGVTVATLLLVLTAFSGAANASGGPVIILSGLHPLTLRVGTQGRISINITGGFVNRTLGYTFFWFFGRTNATSVQAVVQKLSVPSCSIGTSCSNHTVDSIPVEYNQQGSYDVSVTVYDGQFVDYSIGTVLVTVYDAIALCVPLGHTPWNPATAPEGLPVEFIARSTPFPTVTYLWDFGDGTHSTGTYIGNGPCGNDLTHNQATHVFTSPGLHVVTVTVTDTFGAAARKFVFVNVSNPSPVLTVFTAPKPWDTYSPVNFFAEASDANPLDTNNLTFAWNFGDGSNNTTQLGSAAGPDLVSATVSHVYARAGNYTAEVQVTNRQNPISSASPHQTLVVSIIGPRFFGGGSRCYLNPTPVGTNPIFWINACTLKIQNQTCTTMSSPPICAPFYNVTWGSGSSISYGTAGRIASYSYGTDTVPVKVSNATGEQILTGTAPTLFYDVRPTVGVTATYVLPTISFTTNSNCYFSSIVATVYENVRTQVSTATMDGGCGMAPSSPTTLPVVPLNLGNGYLLQLQYSAIGTTGSTTATITFNYAGVGGTSPTAVCTFTNSNPSTWTCDTDLLSESLGQPIFLQTQMFSPADTSLTTQWSFGDSTSTSYMSPAPFTTGPTLVYHTVQHKWASGTGYFISVNTTDPVVGSQGGLVGNDAFVLTDAGELNVSDTAPQVSFTPPSYPVDNQPVQFSANTMNVDGSLIGPTAVNWQFGDNRTVSGSTVVHDYAYGATYAVAVYATSPHGSTSVNWTFVNVRNAAPIPRLVCPGPSVADSSIGFSAVQSYEGVTGSTNLTFGWNFGDSTLAGGTGIFAATVNHVYPNAGRYTLKLIVENEEGQWSSSSCVVTITALSVQATLPAVTVVADQFTLFQPTLTSAPSAILPYLNASWNWGGGWGTWPPSSLGSYGLTAGHTYLVPGNYTEQVTLTDPRSSQATASATIHVVDAAPVISFAYQGAIDYGENHSALFNTTAYGSWADTFPSRLPHPWNFTYVWADGSANTLPSSTSGTVAPSHTYSVGGPIPLNLSVVSPWNRSFTATTKVSTALISIPDWDGDGLPNALEALGGTGTSMLDTQTHPGGNRLAYGTGLTDYNYALQHGFLTNLTSDVDGDGLTSAQEIFGSKTGFVSNPIDANTAGDGVPDGAHFFTDSFSSSSVGSFNYSTPAKIPIPGVQYGGAALGFNQSRLVLVLSTTASLGSIWVTLVTGQGRQILLATSLRPVNNVTDTFYLLNDSPATGPVSPNGYNLSMNDYSELSSWTLDVGTTSSTGTGTIPSALLEDSYYTNPSQADPTHQGLLEGNGLTTPVFNCSAPQNETYPLEDWATFSEINQSYWPYTETYFKLSKLQGVPYVQGNNTSVQQANEASGACPTTLPTSAEGAMASYLGDADFGVSPWNAHEAGDANLTNGMKALGASAYNKTAWKYLNTAAAMIPVSSSFDPYPSDGSAYHAPLNPRALSTAGDSTPDGHAANPAQPLTLEVKVNYATNPSCFPSWDNQQLEVIVDGNANGTTPGVFTNPAKGSGGSGCTGYKQYTGLNVSFNEAYQVPLNNNLSSFNAWFGLSHEDLAANGITSVTLDNSTTIQAATSSSGWISTPAGSNINVSVRVMALPRAPFILVNGTEELESLPGYGYRFTGEQQFYAFYVTLGTNASSPFVPGLNVILESRKAFLQSPLGKAVESGTTNSCFGNANITSRNTTSAESGVVGVWAVNLSNNPSCSSTLLTQLLDMNGTVTVGQYRTLNSTQVALLGLVPQALELAPFTPLVGYNSPQGAPLSSGNIVLGVMNYIAGGIVALVSFIVNLPQEVEALGQYLLGLLSKVAGAIEAIALAALSVLELLLDFIIVFATAAFNALLSPVKNAVTSWGLGASAAYATLWGAINTSANSTTLGKDAIALFLAVFAGPFTVALALGTAALIVIAIVSGFTLGSGFLVGLLVGLVVQALTSAVTYAGFSYTQFLTTQALSASDGIFNASKNLPHSPGPPPPGQSCPGYTVVGDAIGISAGLLSAYFAADDILEIYKTVLEFGNSVGDDWALFVQPIAELAMGMLAALLIVSVHNGVLPTYLVPIAVFLAGAGIVGSAITLVQVKRLGGSLLSPGPVAELAEMALAVNVLALEPIRKPASSGTRF